MLKIRLRRMGKTHAPFYRVVVSDSRRTPTASAVEEVGHYNPRPTPPDVRLDLDRVRYWVDQGALLSPTVAKLVRKAEAAPAPAAAEPAAAKKGGKKAAPAAETKPAAEAKSEAKPAAEAKAESKPETQAAAGAEAAEEAPAAEAAAPKGEAAGEAEGDAEGEAAAEGEETDKSA